MVEEVLSHLGVRQRLPPPGAFFVFFGVGLDAFASSVGISPPSLFPIRTLLRRVASSRAFLILSRSLPCERPTLNE